MNKILLLVSVALLSSCSSQLSNSEKKFDKKNSDLIAPISNIINSKQNGNVNLKYIENYYENAIVCFHSQYSTSNISRKNIDKFKINEKLKIIPKHRYYAENRMGVSIISKGNQYTFLLPVISSNYINDYDPCVRAKSGMIKKEFYGGVTIS